MADFRINHEAVRELAREWGVEGEVEVVRVRRKLDRRTGLYTIKAGVNGQHRFYSRWPAAPLHRIKLVSDRPAYDVAKTLAHELCHAIQASAATSRDPSGWRRLTRREKRLPYHERPIEQEAIAFAIDQWPTVMKRCFT